MNEKQAIRLCQDYKELDKRKEAIKTQLIEHYLLGATQRTAGVFKITNAERKSSHLDQKAIRAAVPELCEACTVTTVSTVFSIRA